MRKLVRIMTLLLLAVVVFTGCTSKASQEAQKEKQYRADENGNKIIPVKIFTRDASAPTRVTNFAKAAKTLNKELEAEGADYRVEVEAVVKPMGGSEFDQHFIFASKTGDTADIYATGFTSIGWMVDGDYIQPLDGIENEEVFKNLMPGYWNPVTLNGHIWGVVQDTEARVVYYYKPALKEMGWTNKEIEVLPAKSESGEFTLDDMINLSKEAMNKGVVKNGYEFDGGGNDLPMNFLNFGAEIYDREKLQFVLDRDNLKQTFEWFEKTAESKVIPETVISTPKDEKLARLINGETLFVQCGIWDEAKFRTRGFHKKLGNVTLDWTMENLGVMILPSAEGNRNITISNPWSYVVPKAAGNLDVIKRLLVHVSTPEPQAEHAVTTSHIPFTKEGQEHQKVLANAWINHVKHFTNYSNFLPNDPQLGKFSKILKDASQNVFIGEMTPDEAVKWMEEQFKLNIDNYVVR